MNITELFLEKIPKEKIIKYFKQCCLAEGATCFLLYMIAMPLKYSFDWVYIMIPAGILHGIFFVLYILLSLPARKIYDWDDEDFIFAILGAFFPFGTFWVEKNLTKNKF